MRFSLKGYRSPTPVKIRRFSHSLLAMCTFLNTYEIMHEHHTMAIFVMLIGAFAQFLSIFWGEDSNGK